jgi:hypothetical protein
MLTKRQTLDFKCCGGENGEKDTNIGTLARERAGLGPTKFAAAQTPLVRFAAR